MNEEEQKNRPEKVTMKVGTPRKSRAIRDECGAQKQKDWPEDTGGKLGTLLGGGKGGVLCKPSSL